MDIRLKLSLKWISMSKSRCKGEFRIISRMEIKTESELSVEEEVIWVDKSNNLYLL